VQVNGATGVGQVSFESIFGCVTPSDSLFDSRGGFSETSYPTKTAEIEGIMDVAMETNFGTTLAANGF